MRPQDVLSFVARCLKGWSRFRGIHYPLNRLLTKIADVTGYNAEEVNAIAQARERWYEQYRSALAELNQKYDPQIHQHFFVEQRKDHFLEDYKWQTTSDPVNSELIIDLVASLSEYLQKHNIEFWLDGGTLLGAYRNGKMIPWDNDADCMIRSSALFKIMHTIVHHPFPTDQYVLRVHPAIFDDPCLSTDSIPLRFYRVEGHIIKAVLDILLVHEINDRHMRIYWEDCYKCRHHRVEFDKNMFFPLKQIMFEGRSYPCPQDPTAVLKTWYGSLSPRKF